MAIKPSEKMKLKILQSGTDHLEFKTKVPDSGLVKHEGGQWVARCKHCGEVLAVFMSKSGKLKEAWDVVGISRVDMEKWSGCRGINLSSDGDIRFECNCGKADIYEVTTNSKRYVEYKIEEA